MKNEISIIWGRASYMNEIKIYRIHKSSRGLKKKTKRWEYESYQFKLLKKVSFGTSTNQKHIKVWNTNWNLQEKINE